MIPRTEDYRRLAKFRVPDLQAIQVSLAQRAGFDLELQAWTSLKPTAELPEFKSRFHLLSEIEMNEYLSALHAEGHIPESALRHLSDHVPAHTPSLNAFSDGILVRLVPRDDDFNMALIIDHWRVDMPPFSETTSHGKPVCRPFVSQSRFSAAAGWRTWQTGPGKTSSLIDMTREIALPF